MSRPERVDSWSRNGGGLERGSVVELREEDESSLEVRRRLGGGYRVDSMSRCYG